MRQVKVYTPAKDSKSGLMTGERMFAYHATFHQFSVWGEDGALDPCAIVEDDLGNVQVVRTDMIQFSQPC